MKAVFLLGSLVGALLTVGCGDRPAAATPAASVAPAVKLTAGEWEKYLGSLKGKVVLVNFWATWCGPCRREIPSLIDLQNRYGPKGLQVVGLSIDERPVEHVTAFAQKNGLTYPVYVVGPDVMEALGSFEAIPMTFLLDAEGKKVWAHEGYASLETFEEQIKPLLAKP